MSKRDRAALIGFAFIVCTIMDRRNCIPSRRNCRTFRISSDGQFITKLGDVQWRIGENIVITRPAVDVDMLRPLPGVRNVRDWDGVGFRNWTVLRAYKHSIAVLEVIKVKTLGDFVFKNYGVNSMLQALRRSIAAIGNRNIELPDNGYPIPIILRNRRIWNNVNRETYESTLDGDQRIPINFVGLSHRGPLQEGYNGISNGSKEDKHREYSHERVSVFGFINKFPHLRNFLKWLWIFGRILGLALRIRGIVICWGSLNIGSDALLFEGSFASWQVGSWQSSASFVFAF